MRAVAIKAPYSAEVVERPTPVPLRGDALIRVEAVGLCGTDLGSYRGKNPLVSYPRIIGHEIAGRVVDVADGVSPEWVGRRVAVSPYKNCGKCAACRLGRPNACRNNETLGVQREGALADYAALPVDRLYSTSRLDAEHLALVEPFSIALHAVRRARVTSEDCVLVIGCGGVGAGAVACAAQTGARVLALDLDSGKLARAREYGACAGIDGASTDVAAIVRELSGGEGPSVVIEAVGTPATYRQALELVASCGRITCLGWVSGDVPLEARLIVSKEVEILGSRNATDELSEVIGLFESGRVDPTLLVTDRIGLEQTPAMLERWAANPPGVGKVVVSVSAD